ncbi:hypothetical protein JNB88_31730 [Rhizobium cauense]|uniref:hypothetical protein n=1 Tax=Rhizobium cauense TaxID=1166683 RepID=UPI001C6E484F|nr:hypothetical protein [Rhizobium cauense]MBW9118187.1 hypothetical protein [Rhizobium cauense]
MRNTTSVNSVRASSCVFRPALKAILETLGELDGDTGARQVVASSGLDVVGVEIGAAAASDLDTGEALGAAGGGQPHHRRRLNDVTNLQAKVLAMV